jgi:hypothetical protein
LVPKALTPCKTGRGQASIINNKLEMLKEMGKGVTNQVTQASTQLIIGSRAFGPHRKFLLPFELQHKDRPIFQENFESHEVVRTLSRVDLLEVGDDSEVGVNWEQRVQELVVRCMQYVLESIISCSLSEFELSLHFHWPHRG